MMDIKEASIGTRPGRQFSIRSVLLLTAAVAVLTVPVATWGWPGLVLSIWLAAIMISLLRPWPSISAILLALSMMFLLFLPLAGGNAGPAALRNGCINNLRQIALAINNYESAHGHFPPPYTTDDNGNPLHSWRVLILPYMEETALYNQLDLTKPWHHPDNLAVGKRMPDVYRCPSFEDDSPEMRMTTAYVAIIGDHTAWPRTGQRTIEEISDGMGNTLLLVESEKYRLHWMSTADPSIEMVGPINGVGDTLASGGPHNGISIGAFCDCAYDAPHTG